jgi:hypothetical protein
LRPIRSRAAAADLLPQLEATTIDLLGRRLSFVVELF